MRIRNLFIDNKAVRSLKIDGIPVAFVTEPVAYGYLCFTAEEAGSTVKLHKSTTRAPGLNLQTSTDGQNWESYAVENTITLANEGDKVYFKAVGSNARLASSTSLYNQFQMTGRIAASGNVNSLLEEDEDTAKTVSLAGKDYCYYSLFSACSSLTQVPELPATTLASYCYQYMFQNCTSLTSAPTLPATTLTDYCYSQMFLGCSSLIKAPALPAITLANNCYYQMFRNCTALEQAPALPATTLVDNCYYWMFNGCTKLNSVKVAFTEWVPTNATNSWLPANTGIFECPWDLITNTSTRSTGTVPDTWTMVAV